MGTLYSEFIAQRGERSHARERRRGTGRALAERCAAELLARGIAKCHLFVFSDNSGAIAFWERTGWAVRADIAIMSRALQPGSAPR